MQLQQTDHEKQVLSKERDNLMGKLEVAKEEMKNLPTKEQLTKYSVEIVNLVYGEL